MAVNRVEFAGDGMVMSSIGFPPEYFNLLNSIVANCVEIVRGWSENHLAPISAVESSEIGKRIGAALAGQRPGVSGDSQ